MDGPNDLSPSHANSRQPNAALESKLARTPTNASILIAKIFNVTIEAGKMSVFPDPEGGLCGMCQGNKTVAIPLNGSGTVDGGKGQIQVEVSERSELPGDRKLTICSRRIESVGRGCRKQHRGRHQGRQRIQPDGSPVPDPRVAQLARTRCPLAWAGPDGVQLREALVPDFR